VSPYVNLTIRGRVRLRDLLKHLYVLIPVFDVQKHYWVGTDEVDKLLRVGEDWLGSHPMKEYITERYLKRRHQLVTIAYERLAAASADDGDVIPDECEPAPDKGPSLRDVRMAAVLDQIKACGATSVIDLGCGEGNLLRLLVPDTTFRKIAGVDVSHSALQRCAAKLRLDQAGESMVERLSLFQGSLTYQDTRFSGFDVACLVEVIEHVDPPRLPALEKVVFRYAKPRTVIVTTPNREYNAAFGLETYLRHGDHRFEWTRAEFQEWATGVADEFGYSVRFVGIGDEDETNGTPTQMAVFACS